MRGQVITDKEYQKEMGLLDSCNMGYGGLSGINSYKELPMELFVFVEEQFARFGITQVPEDIIERSAWAAFIAIDYMDPYSMYTGLTDVEISDCWYENTYDIKDYNGSVHEANPEMLETFRLVRGQDERNFDKVYNDPGLLSKHIDSIGDTIEEVISGISVSDQDYYMESPDEVKVWLDERSPAFVDVSQIPPIFITELRKEYSHTADAGERVYFDNPVESKATIKDYRKAKSGDFTKGLGYERLLEPDAVKFFEGCMHNEKAGEVRLDYFRLGAWAALAWFISPMARTWRGQTYDIFNVCYSNEEAVLYEGIVLQTNSYKKIERYAESCVVCGLKSWCVELTFLEGVTRNLCEHHLNADLPKMGPMMCGTKVCKYTECTFHPLNGVVGGRGLAYRNSGQLQTMIKNNMPMIANPVRNTQKLLC